MKPQSGQPVNSPSFELGTSQLQIYRAATTSTCSVYQDMYNVYDTVLQFIWGMLGTVQFTIFCFPISYLQT